MTRLWRLKAYLLLGGLFSQVVLAQNQQQFVSLTLCSDRLLMAIARPEQIAAMSVYSNHPLMMLDKVNNDKPTLQPHFTELLPYLDKTILINESFYPQLVASLKPLGVKMIAVDDYPATPQQLFELIKQLGEVTQNEQRAQQLIASLRAQRYPLKDSHNSVLVLSDTGVVDTDLPQYQTLFNLLGLQPLTQRLTPQNFSLEKILLSQPNVLIRLTDKESYSQASELLTHPLLNSLFHNRPQATIPMKYTYCFDHGVWLGAEKIYQQMSIQYHNE